MKLSLLTILILGYFSFTNAQLPAIDYKSTSYKTGYLILHSNDTLKGLFKQTATLNFKYKLFDGAETKKYKYDEVKAYLQYSDLSLFMKIDGNFQKLLIDGSVALYLRIVNMGNGTIYYYSVKRQNEDKLTLLRVNAIQGLDHFITQASEYFKDNVNIVTDIQEGKYNKRKKIEEMIIRYNEWSSSQ